MKLRFAGQTDVGRVRDHNEDTFQLLPEHNLFVVADGMGGHASGEVASSVAVKTATSFIQSMAADAEVTWPHKEDRSNSFDYNRIENSIKLANRRVFETSQSEARLKGMGTTLVGLLATADGILLGHVGDSRGYLVQNGEIQQLTEDHSLLNDYLKTHSMTEEEISNFPHKNVIVRALGIQERVDVDVCCVRPQVGSVYLMCSDGLSGMVDDAAILQIITEYCDNLEAACRALIAAANDNGGTDNITVVLVAVDAL